MCSRSAPRCAGEATGPPLDTGGGRAGAAGRGDCRLQGGAVRSVAGDTVDWNDLIIFTELKWLNNAELLNVLFEVVIWLK